MEIHTKGIVVALAERTGARTPTTPSLAYTSLVSAIAEVHGRARAGTASAINQYLVTRNWLIGSYIVEFEQSGRGRAKYGEGLLKRLSGDLRGRRVDGCSPQMLERMRAFYIAYPQVGAAISSSPMRKRDFRALAGTRGTSSPGMRKSALRTPKPLPAHCVLQLSWTKLIELLGIDDPWKRAFYENECLRGNWSVRHLQRQIGSLLYERTGLSTDKRAVIERHRNSSTSTRSDIGEVIRDPYVLEFVGMADASRHRESQLETALLNHIQAFLLELGAGFCFESRQKRITVGNEHDYIDLVFYHRILRCHVLIELKVRPFEHGDAGQMNFYLNYWKSEITRHDDNPPIGLLLCSNKDEVKVKYATGGLDHQLFVSRYLVALPKPEELQQLIERDRALWEQQGP